MLGPYRQILALPGTLAFSSAGLLMRFPASMVGIGIVLMISALYDSYAVAGRVSAAFILTQAVCAPQIARLVDRHGQARIMRPALACAATGLVALVVAAVLGAPEWSLYPIAVLAGATIGSMGSLVRSRWAQTVRSPRDLHTAFSLESSLDELSFVLGPVLATWLATAVWPAAGIVLAVVLAVVGGYTFLAQRATEPVPVPVPRGTRDAALLRSGAMVGLLAVFVCTGGIFGAADVATVAFAEQQGAKSWAGPLLGLFATGSFLAGLLYGSRHWSSPLWQRLLTGVAVLAAGLSLLLLVTSLPALAVVLFVAGVGIAPTIINGTGLIQQIVAPQRLTEGLSWMSTALGIGVALGASLAGQLIELGGARLGLAVVVVAGWLALVAAVVSLPTLRRQAGDRTTLPPREGEALGA